MTRGHLLTTPPAAVVTFFVVLFHRYSVSVAARRPVAPVEYPMHPSEVVYQKISAVRRG